MTEDFKSLLEAYEEQVRTLFLFDLFLSSRNLQGEIEEFINEKKLELNLNGDGK